MTNLKVYRIVLASPSDVAPDRETVVTSVEEANRLLFNQGVAFKIIRWEKDVIPGVSSYPQALINKQTLDHFDVMIALFGTRIGSPTPNAVSGTAEEIQIAQKNENSPFGDYRLATYFKRTSIDSFDGDADQLTKLQIFQRDLQRQNVLTEAYRDENQLAEKIRLLLFKLVEKVANGQIGSPILESLVMQEEATSEEGILDFLEKYERFMAEATKHLGLAAEEMTNFNIKTVDHGKVIAEIPKDSSVAVRKDVTNKFAAMMNSAAEAISLQLNSARNKINKSLDAAISAINLQLTDIGSDQSELVGLASQLQSFKDVAIGAAKSWHDAGAAVQGLPRLTKEVNDAKRNMMKTVVVLDELAMEISRKIDAILERVEIVLKS
jgi:flagellin-like hook-associated protein FlgL